MERETMLHLERVELQSIIGLLQHFSCIVKPGRTFLWRMIALLPVAKKPHHRIRLNAGFRSDLIWWAIFLPRWNGTGMMDRVTRAGHAATITSDASGSWGYGAYTTEVEWFQLRWPPACREVHITARSSSNHSGDSNLGAAVDRPGSAMSMRHGQTSAESLGGTHTGNGKPKRRCTIQK